MCRQGAMRTMAGPRLIAFSLRALPAAFALLGGCNSRASQGEKLARTYCVACHAFPDPTLLDKKTWREGVLPQMARRVGVRPKSLAEEMSRSPNTAVLSGEVSADDWQKIVGYFLERAPDSLPSQSLPAAPQVDPAFFKVGPFVPGLQSSGIITLLKVDSAHERIFVGEAGSNTLRILDWNRRLLSSLKLGSPPTDLIVDGDRVLLLESGILDPNDEPRGILLEYALVGRDSLQLRKTVIDSLFRPVYV